MEPRLLLALRQTEVHYQQAVVVADVVAETAVLMAPTVVGRAQVLDKEQRHENLERLQATYMQEVAVAHPAVVALEEAVMAAKAELLELPTRAEVAAQVWVAEALVLALVAPASSLSASTRRRQHEICTDY